MSLHFPSLQQPIAGGEKIDPVWAKYLRDIQIAVTAELSPGRIAPFYLSAADLADATQFVQAGTTAGLGVGTRLGWALCNGNNGTPSLNGKSLRWSTAAAGTNSGSDSNAHTHDVDIPALGTTASGASSAANTGNESAHTHTMKSHTHLVPIGMRSDSTMHAYPAAAVTQAYATATRSYDTGFAHDASTDGTWTRTGACEDNTSDAGSAHNHTITHTHDIDHNHPSTTSTGGGSVTGNIPASQTLVPLMRV